MHEYHSDGFKILNENYVPAPEILDEQALTLARIAKMVGGALGGNDIIRHAEGSDGAIPNIPGIGDMDNYKPKPEGGDYDGGGIGGAFDNVFTAAELGAIVNAVTGRGMMAGGGAGAIMGGLYSLANAADDVRKPPNTDPDQMRRSPFAAYGGMR